ncbi:MAG: hypothetical protein AB7L92_02600 [Alphaproteobacteria bacterium]
MEPQHKEHRKERDKRVGREVAFGIQQTFACWVTDFIDPPVSKWFQTKFGDKNHKVTHKHVWYGEFAGDTAAFAVYMFAKRVLTKPVDATIAAFKSSADPMLTRMGKKALKPWAERKHLTPDDPRYQQRLQEYKQFQAENVVDSAIVASSSTLLNVATQRHLLHNHQPIKVILASKLVGAASTVALMLGLRAAVPDSMSSLDDELSERYFSKMIRHTRRMFGLHYDPPVAVPAPADAASLFDEDTRRKLWRMVAQHKNIAEPGNAPLSTGFIQQEKQLLLALADILGKDGDFSRQFAGMHHAMIKKLYQHISAQIDDAGSLVDPVASQRSVESILHNRREDLKRLAGVLDEPAVQQEIMAASQDMSALVYPRALTEKKREFLIASLLQPRQSIKGEPAVHIYANARGQMIEHDVLACCFDPEGPLTKALAEALHERLPDMGKDQLTAVAKNYMADRQHAALLATQACQLDGEIVTEAVARSQALQHKYYTSPQEAAALRM